MPERASRTVLAFDFGLKRIGVAVGEPELRSAHPLPAIAAAGNARFAAIEKLVHEWNPARLVVGRPLSAQGGAHLTTRQAERFAQRLQGRFRLPVARVDERYTSVEAESRLRGSRGKSGTRGDAKGAVDSVAAQLMLEQYFDELA
jgi:putative Holliday junction resolvase